MIIFLTSELGNVFKDEEEESENVKWRQNPDLPP
jgi:hypothetical protein